MSMTIDDTWWPKFYEVRNIETLSKKVELTGPKDFINQIIDVYYVYYSNTLNSYSTHKRTPKSTKLKLEFEMATLLNLRSETIME